MKRLDIARHNLSRTAQDAAGIPPELDEWEMDEEIARCAIQLMAEVH